MEVPRPGVKSELQIPAYTTATAIPDPSHIWDLHHSLWQRQILNPLCQARDQTPASNGTRASAVRFLTHWTTKRTLAFFTFEAASNDPIHVFKTLSEAKSLQTLGLDCDRSSSYFFSNLQSPCLLYKLAFLHRNKPETPG